MTKKFGLYIEYGSTLEKEYEFEDGMTWTEWIASSYNVDSWTISGTMIKNGSNRLYDYTNSVTIDKSEIISESLHYGLTNEPD